MLAKARSRSSSFTPLTWSKRASALRTWEASVSGSLRCSGKANTESGRSFLSAVFRSPWVVWGFHVVLLMPDAYPDPLRLNTSVTPAGRLCTSAAGRSVVRDTGAGADGCSPGLGQHRVQLLGGERVGGTGPVRGDGERHADDVAGGVDQR